MAKTILSPLFLMVFFIFLYIIAYFFCVRRRREYIKYLTAILAAVTLVFCVISTPVVSEFLAYRLEKQFADFSEEQIETDVEIVTVLSGGLHRGPEAELDMPGGSSITRVVRGVRFFKESNANYLVLQGGISGPKPERMTELMKEVALEMGISGNEIILEPVSRNTYQHPRELLKTKEIVGGESIAVVTSAWHLRRAEREFEKYFDKVVCVPAEFYSYSYESGLQRWLPGISGLQVSTKVIHEMVGMVWYRVKGS